MSVKILRHRVPADESFRNITNKQKIIIIIKFSIRTAFVLHYHRTTRKYRIEVPPAFSLVPDPIRKFSNRNFLRINEILKKKYIRLFMVIRILRFICILFAEIERKKVFHIISITNIYNISQMYVQYSRSISISAQCNDFPVCCQSISVYK